MLKQHLKICGIIISLFLLPLISFAQMREVGCSKSGYTVVTINGIFTKEGILGGTDGAEGNRKAVASLVPPIYRGEPLTVRYIYNPTHGTILDLSDVAIQKTYEGGDIGDPDFLRILNTASAQIKTQKVLFVAHSQGNFYANNLHKTITESGDLFARSIGVYSVATPASYVAGGGIYRTSDTDTVINRARKILPGTILEAKDSIKYLDSDDSGKGHGFREIYLEYRGEEIKREIEESLGKLSTDPTRSEDIICVNPPVALSTVEKITNSVIYPMDLALAAGAVTFTSAKSIAVGTYHIAVNTVKWTYHTTVAVVVWGYDTAVAVAKAGWGVANAIGSFAYDVFTGALSNSQSANNNSASVILATLPTENLPSVSVNNNKTSVVPTVPITNNQPVLTAKTPSQPQAVFVFEPKVQKGNDVPKLVFVGSFATGGGSPTPQILGTQTTTPVVEEVVVTEEEVVNAGAGVPAPALSAPQCAQTLATDGCLLATTTVHFEWSAIEGVGHYLINKNGEYATTTETTLDVEIVDFLDYTLEVVAVSTGGTTSATSTQKVSVATIPIAINEIAWMGTKASPSDEWFEIKNNTGHTIDLSQWELNAKDGTPHVKLTGTIAPRAYLVFERTDNTAIQDVLAHQTYTGALGNSGEQLNLSHASTTMDQTPDGVWVGGENSTTTKKTMERYSSRESGADPENWGTNLGYIKNGTDVNDNQIEGTPGEQNSVSTLINKGQDITSDFTLTADEEEYVVANTLRVNASSTLSVEPGVEIKFYDGWINVHGHLAVAGTKEDPVIIGTLNGNQGGGISVGGGYEDSGYQGVNASATLDYVNIKNINQINAYDNTRLDISNMDLFNSSGGIYAQDTAQISIASSSIRDTQDNHAIAVYEKSRITIASSTITNTIDNDAVGVYDGTMTITNTTIDGVPDDGGVYVYRATLSISDSTIKNVSDSGISLLRATSTISDVVIENAGWTGIEIYRGNTTIASTTISDITGWAGVYVGEGLLSISSSTVKNAADYGIYAYKATTTISNVIVENGGSNGVEIDQGTATITDTTVSGFTDGSGISIYETALPVVISGGEITGNAVGIDVYPDDSAIITNVSVHDNGVSQEDNVVVW